MINIRYPRTKCLHMTTYLCPWVRYMWLWNVSPLRTTMSLSIVICTLKSLAGVWLNVKMPSYQYRKSHYGNKTILRPSYFHNGFSYTSKMASWYWISAQVFVTTQLLQWLHRTSTTYLIVIWLFIFPCCTLGVKKLDECNSLCTFTCFYCSFSMPLRHKNA